jgi:hypothetical protein
MALREKVTAMMASGMAFPKERVYDADHPFHYKSYQDNLYDLMADHVLKAYSEGSGSELHPYVRFGKQCPAKMSSIASSSAMTFNLLGNTQATILPEKQLPQGVYQVQYEKQMYTINLGSGPANLDAFLSNESSKTAIFCEMKLLEWLNEPGTLKESYRNSKYYFTADDSAVSCPIDAYAIFQELIEKITNAKFKRYDAWQMFKHLLAIYNYTSFTTKNAVEAFGMIPSMAGMYNHIILANVVNEFPPERIQDEKTREEYIAVLQQEQIEASRFMEIIRNSGIPHLFDNNCNAGIEVQYMSAKDFSDSLDMPQAKRNYLTRYFT